MPAVVNGAVLGKPVVTPAFLDQTHAQNQKDVLVIDKQQPSPVTKPTNSSQSDTLQILPTFL